MEATKFKQLFDDASCILPNSRMRFLTELNIKCLKHSGDIKCNDIKTAVIEELSEMSQALTKSIRGIGNRMNIVEEFADVAICMQYLIELFDISDEEFNKAVNVKLDRLERKIVECGKYE